MAEINSQADFDALLQLNEARYEDATNTQFGTTADNFIVTQPRDTVITTPSLASNDQTITFNADNCFINFTDAAASGGSTTDNWLGGTLNITNSTLNYTGGGGTAFVWPGFGATGGNNVNTGQPVADRYVSNLSNTRIVGDFTLQFQGGNIAGHNLTGLDISAGPAPFFLFGMADLVGIAFSNAVGNSATRQGGTTGPVNVRLDNPVGSNAGGGVGVLNLTWWGFFGCDFTRWTNNGAQDVHINWITNNNHFINTNEPTLFIVDGDLSPNIISDGFRVNSSSGNLRIVSGVSFNPQFRDNVNFQPLTDDIFVDFGLRTIWEGQATRDFDTIPVERPSAGIVQVNATGQNGYVIETARNTNQATFSVIAAPNFTGSLNYWAYQHQSYSIADGTNLNVVPTNRAWASSMQFADTQNIDLVAETALNGNNLAAARGMIATGLTGLGNAFAAYKSIYYDRRDTTFPFFNSNTIRFDAGALDVSIAENGITDLNYNATAVDLTFDTATADLNGLALVTTGTITGINNTVRETIIATAGQSTFTLGGNIENVGDVTSFTIGNTAVPQPAWTIDPVNNTVGNFSVFAAAGDEVVIEYTNNSVITLTNGTIGGNEFQVGAMTLGNGLTINGGTVTGITTGAQLGNGLTIDGDPTFTLTGDLDISEVDINFNSAVNFQGTGVVTHRTGQNPHGFTSDDGSVTFVAVDAILNFTNEANPAGGRLAILRWNGTAWEQQGTTVTVGANATTTITSNESGQHLAIWRSLNRREATRFMQTRDYPSGSRDSITVANNPIAEALLYPTNPAPSPTATITWSQTTIGSSVELLGEVNGTTATSAPNGAETQFLMLGAYLDEDYVAVIVNRIINLGQVLADTNLIIRDIIEPNGASSTRTDGEFIQLDTASGNQQFLTDVTGVDINGNDNTGVITNAIVAQITGTDGSNDPISFPAVSLLPNPAGVTVAEILGAFATSTESLERGLSYMVGAMDSNPIIQAPRGYTFDNTQNEGSDAVRYPDLGE